MLNGHKLSRSGSNQSQPKIFPHGTGSSDSSSALTVENVKRLEKEYMPSKEAFKRQQIQDYIEQANLALFSKETTRKTSTALVLNAEPEEASSPLPAKPSKSCKAICRKTPEEISRKDKLLTAPEIVSPPPQTAGCKPKESKLLFQLGRKGKSSSPTTANQHKTTLHTTHAAATRPIYIGRGGSAVFLALRYKR